MKRKIKFRGKRVDNGEWVVGDLNQREENNFFITYQHEGIWDIIEGGHEVIPETVGQFTGLTDKNGKEIFEGDIVLFHATTTPTLHKGYCQDPYRKGQVFFVNNLESGWTLTDPKGMGSKIPNQTCHVHNYEFWNNHRSFEIIGNIHDNPELLKP